MKQIEPTAHILHITDSYGQLDNLLALDEPSRHISAFISEPSNRIIAENTVTANSHYKLKFVSQEELPKLDSEVLIVSLKDRLGFLNSGILLKEPSKCLILMNEGKLLMQHQNLTSGMRLVFENDVLQIYKWA